MTARESVLEALSALLTAVPGASFFRSRQAAFDRTEGIAINLQPEEEQVEKRASNADITLRNLTIVVLIVARGDVPDQTADPIIQLAHAAVMKDPTLGGLCAQIIEQSTKWEFAEADLTAQTAELRYVVRYMTRASDISQQT